MPRGINKQRIIGTKNATKVLRDGDVVEVDAERGVVKILKKNKTGLRKCFKRGNKSEVPQNRGAEKGVVKNFKKIMTIKAEF